MYPIKIGTESPVSEKVPSFLSVGIVTSNNPKLSAFGISPSDKTNNEEYSPASSQSYSIKAGVLTPFIADHTLKASPSTGIILSASSCTKSQETTFNNTDFGDTSSLSLLQAASIAQIPARKNIFVFITLSFNCVTIV